MEQGKSYCRPLEPEPEPPPFCSRTLGVVNCWQDPATLADHPAGVADGLAVLTPEQEANYYAVELRENMAEEIRRRFPRVKAITGDCQARLSFGDGQVDRYIAVHVMEHLPDLPSCVREAYRILNRQTGQLLVVIPCEGSPAYSLARKISAERVYNRHFKGGYSWLISREHINRPHEILAELDPYFTVEKKVLFPLPFLPFVFNNLCIGLSLKPRPAPLAR